MSKRLVLDANILIRAVLGTHASRLIEEYASSTSFLTADEAFEGAAKYVPGILTKSGGNEEVADAALSKLERLGRLIQTIPVDNLAAYEAEARERLKRRDEEDWPYLALAEMFDCPIWTEDTDFFGTGVAVWTSGNVELFLKRSRRF